MKKILTIGLVIMGIILVLKINFHLSSSVDEYIKIIPPVIIIQKDITIIAPASLNITELPNRKIRIKIPKFTVIRPDLSKRTALKYNVDTFYVE